MTLLPAFYSLGATFAENANDKEFALAWSFGWPSQTGTVGTIGNWQQQSTAFSLGSLREFSYECVIGALRLSDAWLLVGRVLLVHGQSLIVATVCLDEYCSAEHTRAVGGSCWLCCTDVSVRQTWRQEAFASINYTLADRSTRS